MNAIEISVDIDFDLYFDTIVDALSLVYNGTESSAVSSADEAIFWGIDAPVTVTMTTQVCSSSSLPSELLITYVIFSAVVNAVTSTTTLYVSPSSSNNNHNNNNNGSNDGYMNVFESADITKKNKTSSP